VTRAIQSFCENNWRGRDSAKAPVARGVSLMCRESSRILSLLVRATLPLPRKVATTGDSAGMTARATLIRSSR
jgi:hypothetical protein